MKRHWSQIMGLPVVTTSENAQVGLVTGVYLDPEKGKVLAYRSGLGKVFSPMDVDSWHSNKVEIFDEEALTPPSEISRLKSFGFKRMLIHKKKVYTRSGIKLGRVKDFCLESATSSLLSIEVSKHFLIWEWDPRTYLFGDIQEITENSIILNVEPEQKLRAKSKERVDAKSAIRLNPISTSKGL